MVENSNLHSEAEPSEETCSVANDMATLKSEVRAEIRKRRNAMTAEERAEKSAKICASLIESICSVQASPDTIKACSEKPLLIGAYSAMKAEVSLDALFAVASEHNWEIALPCMVTDSNTNDSVYMQFVRISADAARKKEADFLRYPSRAFDIASLKDFPLVQPEEIDVLISPLVAFDALGFRLGYGGGNYDRYIPRLSKECLVIGVAFEEQRVSKVPTEPFDVVLPRIISA